MLTRPVAHIDLAKLRRNVATIAAHLTGDQPIMATIKANAYGHGLVPIAQELVNTGITWLAVATGEEAQTLRNAGIDTNILVLTPVLDPNLVREIGASGVRLTLTDEHVLAVYEASGLGNELKLHIKVDTGMGRLGWQPSDPGLVSTAIHAAKRHTLEGCFTHFARSDEADGKAATMKQLAKLEQALEQLAFAGITGLIRHAANTAATFAYPETHLDMVRSGIALYGYNPSSDVHSRAGTLEPIAHVEAPLVSSRPVPAGTTVGYGGRFIAEQDGFLHTVRFGYADGYPRVLSAPPLVAASGQLYAVTGRVCMDQMMFMSEEELPIGTPITMWGGPGFSADHLGALAGTVSYEVLTSLGNRVDRHYVNG